MLTRVSAATAAAAATVVAAADSVASAAARGLDASRRAGRCLPAKHTRARTARACAILKAVGGNE
jgi:hypothetical protein